MAQQTKHHFTHRPTVQGPFEWESAGTFDDILYEKGKAGTDTQGIAKITINRPETRNAFRPLTVREMMRALDDARDDGSIGVIILTGAGDKAFCSGGDQKIRGDHGYNEQDGSPGHLFSLTFSFSFSFSPALSFIIRTACWE